MSGYIGTQPIPQSTQTRETFTATASQTSFATGGYQAGYIDVFLNGVKLVDGTDFTATNGSDVVLTTGAASGDTLEVVAYTAFTVADQTFTGDIVMSDGLTVDNDGATVLTVDRATSDGTIIDIQKSGTTVGSIGSVTGDAYIATGDVGLRFDDGNNILRPVSSSGADQDATINIGGPSQRFKSAYLSSGVYLGGTGAANKLDDYEEGTWTPVYLTGVTSPIYSNTTGSYTKIGDLVTFTARIELSSGTANSSQVVIAGLPFTSISGPPDGGNKAQGGATVNYQAGFQIDMNMSLHVPAQTTEIRFYNQSSGGTLAGTAVSNVAAVIHMNGFYYTA